MLDSKKLTMQTSNKSILSFICAGLLVFQSCKKDYFDLNENPNQVSNPSLSSLLSTATHKTGINNYNVGSITSSHVQYVANPTAASATDIYQEIDYTGTWDALYYAMADITDLKKLAIKEGSNDYLGVANVLLSYHLGLVTDLWGDAPFSDAFSPETFTPKYDSQNDLYKSELDLLDSAIAQLSRPSSTILLSTTNDLIHKGVKANWLKTAYALKARLLNKISKTSNYNAASVLAAVDKAYTSNTDDAGMASFSLRNPWAQVSRNNASLTLGGWLSEQLVEHLNGVSYGVFDPRIRKITDPNPTPTNGIWIGTENGAGNKAPGNNTVKDENYISFNSPWTSDVAPVLIITYSELKFIEAEAALAAANPTRAYTAYLAGINANMDKLQVTATDAERTAYVTAASVGSANLTKALIMKEKYVATYLNPEAWNDARRFDYAYKNFTLPKNAVLSSFIRRLSYPSGERSKNGANIPTIGSLADKLWWDK
jgi:hypothetical protein